MLERERREDQADRLVILPTARGHSARGAGRIMKSPREVLIRPIALSLAAILFTTVLVAEVYSHATALHVRDPEDLALALDPIPRASRAIGRAKLHGCDAFEAKLQAWGKAVGPSPSICSLNRMPGPALATIDASVALRTPRWCLRPLHTR